MIKSWLPAVFVMSVIFVLSSIPGAVINSVGLGKASYQIDGHFVLFLLLYFAYFKATQSKWHALLLLVLYAFIDEFHQYFIPDRSPSLFDIIVDVSAGCIGVLYIWYRSLTQKT